MSNLPRIVVTCLFIASLPAGAQDGAPPAGEAASGIANPAATSERLEKELQQLDWKQFKAVVSAVPKLKADVDAYGPLGWQYVQANYRTYRWKKTIDKLDPAQREQLAELVRNARRDGGAPR